MTNTPEYVIWTPKFDGDAPPNWRGGMAWGLNIDGSDFSPNLTPLWVSGNTYTVPAEAIATPFDYPTWAAQGRANADKLPSGVAEALGSERDWADELEREYLRGGSTLADFLRARTRPIGNDTMTDEIWTLDEAARAAVKISQTLYYAKGATQ